MLHTPYFLLSRPLTYYGTVQQFELELEQDDDVSDDEFSELQGFMFDKNKKNPTGLFLHWLDH